MFATGSGAINMARQSALAIGVAIYVAILGTAATPAARIGAFHLGWWVLAGIIAVGLIPTFALIRTKKAA
jgi:hypothetical protein